MDRESAPYVPADFFAEQIRQRLTAMDVEVIHNEMDRVGVGVLHRQIEGYLSELDGRAVRCGKREVAPGLRLNRAEDVSRAASFIFAARLASRPGSAAEGGRTSA